MSKEKLKIGVFGGYRGGTMIDALLLRDDATLVAVCDKYTNILDGVKEKGKKAGMEIACYECFDDFFD